MITASDSEHTRLRKIVGPAFLNSGIKEIEPVVQQYVDRLCYEIKDASSDGSSQNLVEW
jgi:cytochrome P450